MRKIFEIDKVLSEKKDGTNFIVERYFGSEELMPLYIEYVCDKIKSEKEKNLAIAS